MYRSRSSFRLAGAASLLALGAACVLPAHAQSGGPLDPADEVSPRETASAPDDRVIVTGTRGVTRTVDDSVAPIDVLSGDAIESATKANLLETLNTLVPSFNLPNVNTPNVGSMVRAGTLRGLNPDQTLTLVNGKRRHSTAFLGAGGYSASAPVDLSMIASGSIERIEVLRDGASAIYGSDAIAGVINIITDHSGEGGELSVRGGQFFEGDGFTNVIKASQGFTIGDTGHLRISGQIDDQEIVIRNSPVNPNLLFYFPINNITGLEVTPSGPLSSYPQLPAGASRNPREATRNNNAWINQGKAPYRLEAFSADFGSELAPDLSWYGFATYAKRESKAPQNFRTPNRDENVRAIYPDGFTPVEAIDEQDYSLLTGLRGDTPGFWAWDLSLYYGKDDLDIFVLNSINATYGLNSQTDFFIGNLQSEATIANLDVRESYEDFIVPTDVSLGVEFRNEHYEMNAGDVQGYTHGGARVLDGPRAGTVLPRSLGVSQALPAFRPDDEQNIDRFSASIYGAATLHLTPNWVVDLAGRLETYADFGGAQTGRISTRYDFGPAFALRATVANGFHAPALAAQAYKNTGNANTSTNHVLQVTSPEAIALGAKPLTPETSVNYSAGFVLRPFGDFTLAVDAYQIDIEDVITQSTQFNNTTYPGSGVLVSAAGFDPNDGISYFVNAVDTRNRGVEVTANVSTDLGPWGEVRWSYAGAWNETKVTHVAATPSVLAAFNIPVFSQGSITNLQNRSPKQKHVLGADWSIGDLDIGVRETYYGALTRSGNPNPVPTTGPYAGQTTIFYDIGGLWVTDLNISYDFTDNLGITLSANNIFEEKPDLLPTPLLAAQQLYQYTNNGPIGAEGGFYSATLRYNW